MDYSGIRNFNSSNGPVRGFYDEIYRPRKGTETHDKNFTYTRQDNGWYCDQDEDYRCNKRRKTHHKNQKWSKYNACDPNKMRYTSRRIPEMKLSSGGQIFGDDKLQSENSQRQFCRPSFNYESGFHNPGRSSKQQRHLHEMGPTRDPASSVRSRGNYVPPPSAESTAQFSCPKNTHWSPDPNLQSNYPGNQVVHPNVHPTYMNTFGVSVSQNCQRVWNQRSPKTLGSTAETIKDLCYAENKESDLVYLQASVLNGDKTMVSTTNCGQDKFETLYFHARPEDPVLPSHAIITSQQPTNYMQTTKETNAILPHWEQRHRIFVPINDQRSSTTPMLSRAQFFPSYSLETVPTSVRDQNSFPNFRHPNPTVFDLLSNPLIRTSVPPPQLPPTTRDIAGSAEADVPSNVPGVQSLYVSDVSQTAQISNDSCDPCVPPFDVRARTEAVGTGVGFQGIPQTSGTDPQNLTTQFVGTEQESDVRGTLAVTGPALSADAVQTTPENPLNAEDLPILIERLIAAGLIPATQTERKVEDEETEVKSGNDSTNIEDLTSPIVVTEEGIKGENPGLIRALFRGTQCGSCDRRFEDINGELYKSHLDWHYRATKREKEATKKGCSQKWFYDVNVWIDCDEDEDSGGTEPNFFENEANEEKLKTPAVIIEPTVPASKIQDIEVCVVCGEAFKFFWNDEEDEWHLKNAMREDGQLCHPICSENLRKVSEVSETMFCEVSLAKPMLDFKYEKKEVKTISEEETNIRSASDVKMFVFEGKENYVAIKEEVFEEEILECKQTEEETVELSTKTELVEEDKEHTLQSVSPVRVKVEFRPQTPDPPFKVLPPVSKGTELSGLCTIM